jgi:hypothetical protein
MSLMATWPVLCREKPWITMKRPKIVIRHKNIHTAYFGLSVGGGRIKKFKSIFKNQILKTSFS